eukprot:CAMPEP_0119012356 /NCGR_PEP_ID=MMETSP1176-20130426/6482_1 /TAXON_ID=265551 /ORGANISM="Synedropsis recta cf, Strain CCMP1620" /LENGTH=164 /DNA_ID=CAMNT_0006965293 /DNA_START=120 /DNA_END=614 /DNA_ORIENTATION=+
MPDWYDRMQQEDETGMLKKCSKRTRQGKLPEIGQKCAKKPKMCYFGTQDCLGVGAHPGNKCFCDGNTWNCEFTTCPPVLPPVVVADVCPSENPSGENNLFCSIVDMECSYKEESAPKYAGAYCTETTTCTCRTTFTNRITGAFDPNSTTGAFDCKLTDSSCIQA